MEKHREVGLEERILYPAAARPADGQPMVRPGLSKTKFGVSLGRNELSIRLSGCLSPESFLGGLGQLLRAADGHRRLCLDLTAADMLDHLGLSALIVSLRHHCDGYARMAVRGLEPWAEQRLEDTGAANLFGRDWLLEREDDRLVFRRLGVHSMAGRPAARPRRLGFKQAGRKNT